ncbi:hypothetical protein C1H46_025984 [Malus baccata]|uniref:Homeobox domain-containing protein n=1 Tax=Malus baccata TaxID=106549 RepID=A0A540LPP5_MALBA|nr:hypothetical protein C1H46_025984 [Malus baccata]
MGLAFTGSSGGSMRYLPTLSNPHSHSHCLPSPLLFHSSLPQRFNLHSMAVKPIKRVRCELQAKVNGALSADSDPRFIDRQKALEAAMNDINSSFGKGSVTRLGSAGGALVETFPSGCLTLDLALGGGLPKGRIVEIFGPESSGKTTLALHAIAEVQKLGGNAMLVDAEHAFDPAYSRALGVDVENLIVCQPDHGEMALEIADRMCRSGAIDLICVDSVSALTPRAEIEGEIGMQQMGLQARLMSQALRKMSGNASKAGCTLIFLNQIRYKIGVYYGNPEVTSGGIALKFFASVRLEIRSTGKIKSGCILDCAEAMDVVVRKGSWYSYGDHRLGQGRDKALQYLRENPLLLDEMEKRMELSGNGGASSDEASNSRRGNKKYHRHTNEQIQRLEEFFKHCAHPDDSQRQQLGRELGLEPKQIKFWFQNKRTQTKAQGERADNTILRQDNERIQCENYAMREALKNVSCPTCGGPPFGEEERQINLQSLQLENAYLKEEASIWNINKISSHDKVASLLSKYIGKPLSQIESLASVVGSTLDLSQGCSINQGIIGSPPLDLNLTSPTFSYQLQEIPEMEKTLMADIAASALEELVKLFQIDEPLWVKSTAYGRYFLNRGNYDKIFPRTNQFKTSSARIESSKDSGVVTISAATLVDMFLDSNKWEELFPTIVTKAKTIEVLESGMIGNRSGCLLLMYEQMHILSPLVLPRDFYFLRYCQQIELGTWVVVDVSHKFPKESSSNQSRSWRLPSGCLIKDMTNGCSKVTWIEHVEVDDKTQTHRLYRDLICSSVAYGAERWIITLKRMCERFDCLMDEVESTCEFGGGKSSLIPLVSSPEGKRSVMKLSQRMVKNFCGMLSMAGKLDFPQLSEVNNSGVRVSVRKSAESGQPHGMIVSVATSLWLPLPSETVYNFFRDEKNRVQWDVLSNGNPVHEIANISTGTHPGNCISVIRPFIPTENNMLMLQESYTDPLGSLFVYAPVDVPALNVAVSGEDSSNIPILPSGFVISGDGRAEVTGDSGHSTAGGSLLTVAFQILVSSPSTSKQMNMESVATVNTLISSTVQKIKVALNCSSLD